MLKKFDEIKIDYGAFSDAKLEMKNKVFIFAIVVCKEYYWL